MEEQLFNACSEGKVEEVKKLLLNNPQIDLNWKNKWDNTPLFIACQKGHIEVVKLLLNEERVDVNKPIGHWTPLSTACSNGHLDVVKLLLNNKKIEINPTSPKGTPFFLACENGHTEVMKLLLNDERVDVNIANEYGTTPFNHVCHLFTFDRVKQHIEIAKLLLREKKVDINKANEDGWTPLISSSCSGSISVLEYMLASGRNVSLTSKDKKGKTATDHAKKGGYKDVVQLLDSFQKNPSATRSRLRKELNLPGMITFILFIFFLDQVS